MGFDRHITRFISLTDERRNAHMIESFDVDLHVVGDAILAEEIIHPDGRHPDHIAFSAQFLISHHPIPVGRSPNREPLVYIEINSTSSMFANTFADDDQLAGLTL